MCAAGRAGRTRSANPNFGFLRRGAPPRPNQLPMGLRWASLLSRSLALWARDTQPARSNLAHGGDDDDRRRLQQRDDESAATDCGLAPSGRAPRRLDPMHLNGSDRTRAHSLVSWTPSSYSIVGLPPRLGTTRRSILAAGDLHATRMRVIMHCLCSSRNPSAD